MIAYINHGAIIKSKNEANALTLASKKNMKQRNCFGNKTANAVLFY